jgi:hypothetical protein
VRSETEKAIQHPDILRSHGNRMALFPMLHKSAAAAPQ